MEKDKIIVAGRLAGGAGQYIDRSIDATGYVRTTLIDKASEYVNNDNNTLSH